MPAAPDRNPSPTAAPSPAVTGRYVVALTGGVAAGKSAVARRFAALGVAVADADSAARAALAPGSDGVAEVARVFGAGFIDDAGRLDRAALRRRVFDDAEARQQLEAIVHPRVMRTLREQVVAARGPYVLLDIPLLAETWPQYAWVDRVLVVDVSPETQRHRLMLRDGIDAALAERMIAAQASREQRLALATDVIDNNGDEKALDAAVTALHERYLALAQR
ncbi:MAG TPA: dephospho-CoA kinase [Rhodanobacteraceae bacterium]|nr:dephospho-CoA kinase [Rhodanobacteraceae bacterium]